MRCTERNAGRQKGRESPLFLAEVVAGINRSLQQTARCHGPCSLPVPWGLAEFLLTSVMILYSSLPSGEVAASRHLDPTCQGGTKDSTVVA